MASDQLIFPAVVALDFGIPLLIRRFPRPTLLAARVLVVASRPLSASASC